MSDQTEQNPYFKERQREIAMRKELLDYKFANLTMLYRETLYHINHLRTKTKSTECRDLLEEIDRNTIRLFDLYISVLQSVNDSNKREFPK